MSLRDHIIKTEYRSLIDNVVQDFYIPLLKDAKDYKRAVGFFSSSALVEISKGICTLAKNGGHIQIVASPYLSDDDIKAIQVGYEQKQIIETAVLKQIEHESTDHFSMERLNLLANLIAEGVLDIRIAYTEDKNGIGMYHEKMGIIEDSDGNKVAFSGSMNESATAMAINYETIDTFTNWMNDEDRNRVIHKENAFDAIWNNYEPNITVLQFESISKALIEKYRKAKPNYNIDEEQFGDNADRLGKNSQIKMDTPIGARAPRDIEFYEYQNEAVANWVSENYRGIFDMATGTGKTYTGLKAIAKLSEDIDDCLAVFIICPYQHLVDQWVEDIVRFNISPIIGYSNSPQKDWKKRFSKAVRDQKIRPDKSFFCFVSTNATFKSNFVQEQIEKIRKPILLVADEAHNIGAQSYTKLLDDRFKYRLALSATLERHGDEEGTDFLYSFFGKKCIEYSLERAIDEEKLTPYKYHPVVVTLNEDELLEYENLSFEMSKCIIKDKRGRTKLNKHGEMLAMKRARVVAGAAEKLQALRREIKPFVNDNNILVYCGATNVLDPDSDFSDSDEGDIRQIEAVTRILGLEYNMNVAKFTAMENMEERNLIKQHFLNESLQAIVAIKCLDEGVNIPGIRTAFILASTTNPKEYIQRRGRVLRRAKNKEFAQIIDFVTLPRPLDEVQGLTKEQAGRDLSLVKNELERMKEFGRLSLNPMETNTLVWDIQDAYHIVADEETSGGE